MHRIKGSYQLLAVKAAFTSRAISLQYSFLGTGTTKKRAKIACKISWILLATTFYPGANPNQYLFFQKRGENATHWTTRLGHH